MTYILKNIFGTAAVLMLIAICYGLYFVLNWINEGQRTLDTYEYYSSGAFCSDPHTTNSDALRLQSMEPHIHIGYLPSDLEESLPRRIIMGYNTDSGGPAHCFISITYGVTIPTNPLLHISIYPPAKMNESITGDLLDTQWKCYASSTSDRVSYCSGAILGPDGYSSIWLNGRYNRGILRRIARNISIKYP